MKTAVTVNRRASADSVCTLRAGRSGQERADGCTGEAWQSRGERCQRCPEAEGLLCFTYYNTSHARVSMCRLEDTFWLSALLSSAHYSALTALAPA